jgi:DNA (cytosine-5)-methyltransferase 1
MTPFRFVDLFAGIGGFRLALEAVGGVCVASAEINAQAAEVYRMNWFMDDPDHNVGDISKLEQLPEHDLMVGGVPCQPWSIAGLNKGFDDPRGQLWADVIRLVERNQPKGFIFENVKGMTDPRHSDTLELILDSLRRLGYRVQARLLNAFDYGVPQNRDRVFIVGTRPEFDFEFPPFIENNKRLFEIFELPKPDHVPEVELERDLFGQRVATGFNKLTPKDQHNEFFILNDLRHGPTSIHSWEILETTQRQKDICMTLLRNRRNKKYGDLDGSPLSLEDLQELLPDLEAHELEPLLEQRILIVLDGKYDFVNRRMSSGIDGIYRIFLPTARFFGTLTARGMNDHIAEIAVYGDTPEEYKDNFIHQILRPKRYRPITVREAARLQTFPEHFVFHKSDAVSLRLLGNSIAVDVVKSIAQALVKTGIFESREELVQR